MFVYFPADQSPYTPPRADLARAALADFPASWQTYAANNGILIKEIPGFEFGDSFTHENGENIVRIPGPRAERDTLVHNANIALHDSHIGDINSANNAKHMFRNALKHWLRTQTDADKEDMEEACADYQKTRLHAIRAYYQREGVDYCVGVIREANGVAAGQKIAERANAFHAAYGENISDPQVAAGIAALKARYNGKPAAGSTPAVAALTEAEFLSATNYEDALAAALIEENKRITITASTNSRLFISEFRAGENGVVAQVGETYDLLAGQSVSFDTGWARLEVTALNGETDNSGNPIFADPATIGFDLSTLRYAIGNAAASATRPTFAQAGSSKITITQAAA